MKDDSLGQTGSTTVILSSGHLVMPYGGANALVRPTATSNELAAPNFARTLRTCVYAVFRLMVSRRAISP
jgi:hypothetical protein